MRSSAERWGMLEESVDDRQVGRGHRKSLTFDFVAGLHAYDHGGPLWCVLSKDYFVADNFFVLLFLSFSLSLSLSRLCQCKLLLASPFLLFVFFFATRTWRLCWRRRV